MFITILHSSFMKDKDTIYSGKKENKLNHLLFTLCGHVLTAWFILLFDIYQLSSCVIVLFLRQSIHLSMREIRRMEDNE